MTENATPTTLTDASVRSIRKALVDFGYSGLTDEEVRETGNRLLAGGDDKGDIIAMFMGRMLREAGLLPDPDAA